MHHVKHRVLDTSVIGPRGWVWRLALCALVALLLGHGSVVCHRAPREAPPIQARLELAAGEVTVDLGKGPEAVYSGAALAARARLSTGPGARALARLSDGTALFLRDGTAVQLGSDEVELIQGEVWVDVPATDREAFVHRIGEVSISATDAGLSLRRTAGGMRCYVARGLAVVSGPGGRVEVQAGEQVEVDGAGAPSVTSVVYWEDWTGGMADNRSVGALAGSGTGVIYGIDRGAQSGLRAPTLDLVRMSVRAVVRAGLAETEIDQTFANHGPRDVEGWYWFEVPEGATVTSFAVETHDVLVEGEFIERQEAAAKYTGAVSAGFQPAILEWVDSRTFRARIYPIPASGTRRVVMRYFERLDVSDNVLRYHYPLQSDQPVRIGEFSLAVDLGEPGAQMEISTLADARVEQGGRLVTMRRSGFHPQADFQLEARIKGDQPPLRVSRYDVSADSADYVMVRYTPDVDWEALQNRRADVVVVVDTSAAGDETSRQFKAAAAEAILRTLSEDDRFALLSLDVDSQVLHPATGLAPASDAEITAALERLADHANGGATDLAAFFDVALGRLHEGEQPAVIYVGDGLATSGELTGEQLNERLRRALTTSPARLFAVSVGNDADHTLLSELARTGGGQAFRVDHADEATSQALRLAAAIKTPTITELEIDVGAGLDDVFVSGGGKVSHGQEVILLARTHHDLPDKVTVSGKLAGEPFEKSYRPHVEQGVASAFVPRFWAQEYTRRLLGTAGDPQQVRGQVAQLGIDYGLMTPFTSILALQDEQAYRNMGIERRYSPLRGVRLSELAAEPATSGTAALAAGAPLLLMGCALASGGSEDQNESGWVSSDKAAPSVMVDEPVGAPSGAVVGQLSEVVEVSGMLADAEAGDGEEGMGRDMATSVERSAGSTGGYMGSRGPADRGGAVSSSVEYDGRADGSEQQRRPTVVARQTTPVATAAEQVCSDWASRPLADRYTVWGKRMRTADPGELLQQYIAAKQACEMPDWNSESAFLRLMARRVETEAEAMMVLRAFGHDAATQQYIARLILRGTVDQRVVDAVQGLMLGTRMDWSRIDLELAAIQSLDRRIEVCRGYLALSPDDPDGTLRLIRLLSRAGQTDELLVLVRRLQDRGLMTPLLAREVGDLLAAAGQEHEAVRSYSEIVEFHPDSLASRQLLGDIYLANGWYDQAYRQYATITGEAPDDSLAWLRLAAAAAGEGRVDEALRLERKVAGAAGMPGPDDPRAWARLWSAARFVRLIDDPPADTGTSEDKLADSLRRRLKELQLFRAPGTMVIVTWEDLGCDVALGTYRAGAAAAVGDPTDASAVGLAAVLLPLGELDRTTLRAHLRSLPRDRPLVLRRHDITWDGSSFAIDIRGVELAPMATTVDL